MLQNHENFHIFMMFTTVFLLIKSCTHTRGKQSAGMFVPYKCSSLNVHLLDDVEELAKATGQKQVRFRLWIFKFSMYRFDSDPEWSIVWWHLMVFEYIDILSCFSIIFVDYWGDLKQEKWREKEREGERERERASERVFGSHTPLLNCRTGNLDKKKMLKVKFPILFPHRFLTKRWWLNLIGNTYILTIDKIASWATEKRLLLSIILVVS